MRVYLEHKVQDGTPFPASFLRVRASLHFAMSPHLTPAELDFIFGLASQGKPPAEVHAALSRKRGRPGVQAPTLKRLRGALRGTTYRRSRKETRGRKRKLTRSAVFKMNVAW